MHHPSHHIFSLSTWTFELAYWACRKAAAFHLKLLASGSLHIQKKNFPFIPEPALLKWCAGSPSKGVWQEDWAVQLKSATPLWRSWRDCGSRKAHGFATLITDIGWTWAAVIRSSVNHEKNSRSTLVWLHEAASGNFHLKLKLRFLLKAQFIKVGSSQLFGDLESSIHKPGAKGWTTPTLHVQMTCIKAETHWRIYLLFFRLTLENSYQATGMRRTLFCLLAGLQYNIPDSKATQVNVDATFTHVWVIMYPDVVGEQSCPCAQPTSLLLEMQQPLLPLKHLNLVWRDWDLFQGL